MPNQAMNHCNRITFEAACALLKVAAPKNDFRIESVWMDLGAGMMWETITCYNGSPWGSYQVLNPRDWDALAIADCIGEVVEVVTRIVADQKRSLGIA